MYPEIAIREIAANMIIHQDFNVPGFPMENGAIQHAKRGGSLVTNTPV